MDNWKAERSFGVGSIACVGGGYRMKSDEIAKLESFEPVHDYDGPITAPPGHPVEPLYQNDASGSKILHQNDASGPKILYQNDALIAELKAQQAPKYPTGVDWEDMTPAQRKQVPVVTGVLDYFPDAIASVALVSMIGNDQHNPGEPLHWAREKSTDEINTAGRHLMERGRRDHDGARHLAKAAWRILAALQKEIEGDGGGL